MHAEKLRFFGQFKLNIPKSLGTSILLFRSHFKDWLLLQRYFVASTDPFRLAKKEENVFSIRFNAVMTNLSF